MSIIFLILVLFSATFLAGVMYGRDAEIKLIARAMKAEREAEGNCVLLVEYFHRHIARIKALL